MADGILFQSSTPATPAAGVEVATDDAGGAGHVQIVKLAISTDGSATVIPANATDGLLVEVSNPGDIGAGGGAVMHKATVVSSGLTTASTLYTAGDVMGDLEELTGMASSAGGGGCITTATLVVDVIGVIAGVRAWLFDSSVTLAANNSAFDLSDADILKCVGTITFLPPIPAANAAIATATHINLDYVCDATSLFVAFQTLQTHSSHFAAVDDLHLTVHTALG